MEKAKVSIYVTPTSHTATSSILSSMLLSPYQKVMMRFRMLMLWKVHRMMNMRVTHHRSGCALEKMAPILYLIPFYRISILGDTLGIRLPVDFAIFYQVAQSTSGTESYSEGFTLIASILHKIVSSTVSERT